MESLVLLIKSKLGVLHLTGQMTGKPVKHGNLLVNRWSGKSLQLSALLPAARKGGRRDCRSQTQQLQRRGALGRCHCIFRDHT